MRIAVGTRKDFWTGVLYIVIGLSALAIARSYALGSAARMGPGYFPTAVALLLTAVGVSIVVRSFFRPGEFAGHFAWKPMLLVLGSIVAFGILLNRAGLLLAGVVLVLGCAAASERFRLGWLPVLGMAALIAFCVIVFVIGMGIPMRVIGPWFSGIGE